MKLPMMLNLHTEWEAKGDGVNRDHQLSACYSSNFPCFKGHQDYKIWLFKDFTQINHHRNNTFLGLGELTKHIQFIKDFLPEGVVGDFSIEESEQTMDNGKLKKFYILSISINGENIYHKLVLTWIRYAYELPYSLIILDANRLEEKGEFGNLNLLNKFLLCSSGWTDEGTYYWRSDMSMGHFTMLHPDKTLLKNLEVESKDEKQYLSSVFGNKVANAEYGASDSEFELIDHDDLLETENWTEGKGFDQRLEIYKRNYQLINKEYESETA